MITRFFTIKNQYDIFNAVGQIIKASQEWETQYKEYASRMNLEVKNLDLATLNKLNYALKEQGKITDKEFFNLKQVIKIRNYINHEFFIRDFNKEVGDIDFKLNQAMFLIYEAADLVANLIERAEGFDGNRPTIFD